MIRPDGHKVIGLLVLGMALMKDSIEVSMRTKLPLKSAGRVPRWYPPSPQVRRALANAIR